MSRFTGLRLRLLVALVTTAAATLLVADLTLISPLQGQIRHATQRNLRAHLLDAVPHLNSLLDDDVKRLEAAAKRLHASASARVVLVRDGTPLVDTDAGPRTKASPLPPPSDHVLVATASLSSGIHAGRVTLVRDLSSVPLAVRTVRHALLLAGAAGLALAVLLGAILARGLLRRLRALEDGAQRLAEGEVVELPGARARDEIGALTRSFARMQERLRRQEEARRTFVATASHELRTPLTSLGMTLEMAIADLEPGHVDAGASRAQLERAAEQTQRLTALARDLLDLSRLDAGVELRSEPVELGDIARNVAAEFASRAHAGEVELAVLGDGESWALGDPGAIAQIARILVDNALRFAPAGSAVRIEHRSIGGRPSLRVRDEGHGVSAADAERIFERFSRGSDPGDAPGFGLGLAIGRELARCMGGDVTLEAAGPSPCFVVALRPTVAEDRRHPTGAFAISGPAGSDARP